MKKRFLYSDMADESAARAVNGGYDVNVKNLSDGLTVTTLLIKHEEEAKALNRAKGKYVTIDSEAAPTEEGARRELGKKLRDVLRDLSADTVRVNPRVLVAGLGNRNVVTDALGALTVDNLIVAAKKRTEVAALPIGVYGMTGVESLNVVRGVAAEIKAGLVITVDTLATTRVGRLYKSFQLTDAGLEPGSASKAGRLKINRQSVGIPVIAIGVPMCVYARTIVYDAVEKSDVSGTLKTSAKYDITERVLGAENLNLLLTPKDIDLAVKACAGVIADGINLCFSGEIKRNQ